MAFSPRRTMADLLPMPALRFGDKGTAINWSAVGRRIRRTMGIRCDTG